MKKTYIAFALCIVLLYVAISFSPVGNEDTSSYIVHGDNVIMAEYITGLSIQEYIVASSGDTIVWEHVVKIHGPGQEVQFSTREEAENFMLYLAMEAGI